ncbi:glycoside hydrolase family 17 protein [Trichoderma atroviride IMI 206040]|uniref:Probable beta-glucosidase btgE n=1 Tax=Hypocrea atroviridis (strain ATCC 20476 / IMI 206040) TaxID=452589 RepID=G9NW43_HYPAI|nr:glycoside hydrolase family 17 protein [Trichoderma atroviride IMI 206040]EHK45534.1 glycoside hydrolase family 17 protein [Trichoderma atroviride IMI 206040]
MKGTIAAAAVAAFAGAANASHGHRHAHELFAAKRAQTGDVCVPGCTTIWSTVTGEPTWVPAPPPVTSAAPVAPTTAPAQPTTETQAPSTSEVIVVPVPTPTPVSFSTPGTYTIPATTITLTESTTVCGATSTAVPPGTHTVGGVTTIVETATTVTCPVATVSTSGTVVTSVIVQTTYVCPAAGTYTIAPITTTVPESTVIVYPVPTSYAPGTYTAPQKVVTVTETDYVTWCPFESSGLPTTQPAPTPTPAPASYPPPAAAKPSSSAPVYVPPPVVPKPKPSQAAPKPKPQAPSGGLSGSNDHYGITYTPYEPTTGDCKGASEVEKDISDLKNAGFQVIRVYSTDCNTLENVGGAAKKYGLDLILGVFVKGDGCSYDTPDIKSQVDAISAWAQWDIVKLIVVGNEAIMNSYCSATQLASLITTVKGKCSGYSGPYTISETLNIWQQPAVSSAICPVVDVAGANIHPYFNTATPASSAGDFVAGQLELLNKVCSGKEAINLECGWPKQGSCNGAACPGHSEQTTAIQSIREKCGDKTVFFSFDDDMWKQPGPLGCEQSWGVAAAFSISGIY